MVLMGAAMILAVGVPYAVSRFAYRDHAITLPVALMSARTEQGDAWEIMATMGLFIIAPMLVISRFVQRYFVAGLVSGAVR